jgi:thioredoxin 1
MSNEVTLTDQSFAAEIEEFKGVALVDFWAAWCGPCQILSPLVEEVAD